LLFQQKERKSPHVQQVMDEAKPPYGGNHQQTMQLRLRIMLHQISLIGPVLLVKGTSRPLVQPTATLDAHPLHVLIMSGKP